MSRNSLLALALLSVSATGLAEPTSRPTLMSATRGPAGPAPASRPAVDLLDLQREWDAAMRHVYRARVDAGNRFIATPAGKSAAADLAAKRKALEEARALGAPPDRLAASSAYNKAREARDSATDKAVAVDPEVLRAVTAADLAMAELDRGKAALGLTVNTTAQSSSKPPPGPAPLTVRPEYRIEAGKSFAGMRAIDVTFTVVAGPQQVQDVLRSELMSAVDKDPPTGDVVIYARDDNGGRLTTPDGSAGMVFIEAERKLVTLKDWAALRRR